jgi:hypothetical protein
MKKALSIVLVVFMLFSIMSLSAFATDEENVTDVSNDFTEMEDEEIDFMISDYPVCDEDSYITDGASTEPDETTFEKVAKIIIPIVLVVLVGVVVIIVKKKRK